MSTICKQRVKTTNKETGESKVESCNREYKTQYGYRMHLRTQHNLTDHQIKKTLNK